MKFIIIFGPPAVGKATVAYALGERIGVPIFHNHMTIELVLPFFPFGHPRFNTLVGEFRRRILEEIAESELPGVIFTFVWAFDLPSEKTYVDSLCAIFEQRGGDVFFVELEASLDERLRRNAMPDRLARKPSKRDVESSTSRLLKHDRRHRFNSQGDFYYPERYVKIDNSQLSVEMTVNRIVDAFGW